MLAPQNKILAGFSKREAGAAVYMHAMKTKPHLPRPTVEMKTLFALLLIGLILLPSIAAACPGHKHKKTTCTSTTSLAGVTRTVCR